MGAIRMAGLFVLALSLLVPQAYAQNTLVESEIKTQATKRKLIHTVKKGEELHLLAGHYLLDSRKWTLIRTWNRSVIENKNRIYPGEELLIFVDSDWEPPFDLDEYVKEIGRR